MKINPPLLRLTLSAGLLPLLPNLIQAQPTAHYCPGSEGLMAASVPPPGVYARDYNVFYSADQLNDSAGHGTIPFNVFTYANVPRIIWMSNTKFLGADVGADALLPFVEERVKVAGHTTYSFGVGDLLSAAILAWHPQRFDFVLCDGPWMPTGDHAAGMGCWSDMLTAGATWYVDADKTWTVSALNRYEFNGQERDTHVTPGEAYTLEWGIGKAFPNKMSAGVVGYYQQKITADLDPTATANYNRVAAVGPEIGGLIPGIKVDATLRYEYEFMAEGRAQGQTITLTLTKRF